MATTGTVTPVTTGSGSIKTLLQIKGVTAVRYKIKSWGISFDGSAAAAGIKCELCETGTIFATVTAAVAADLAGIDAPGLSITSTTYFSVGTTATGYTSSGEGTIVASRVFDSQLVQPTGAWAYQWPLGDEPYCDAVSALRIRVNNAGTAVNAVCWVQFEA